MPRGDPSTHGHCLVCPRGDPSPHGYCKVLPAGTYVFVGHVWSAPWEPKRSRLLVGDPHGSRSPHPGAMFSGSAELCLYGSGGAGKYASVRAPGAARLLRWCYCRGAAACLYTQARRRAAAVLLLLPRGMHTVLLCCCAAVVATVLLLCCCCAVVATCAVAAHVLLCGSGICAAACS